MLLVLMKGLFHKVIVGRTLVPYSDPPLFLWARITKTRVTNRLKNYSFFRLAAGIFIATLKACPQMITREMTTKATAGKTTTEIGIVAL